MYLHDTYGVTVYQEQVMLLSQKLAGFTKGKADKLRKAMGKKQIKVMAELKDEFFAGGLEHPEVWSTDIPKPYSIRYGTTGRHLRPTPSTSPMPPATHG